MKKAIILYIRVIHEGYLAFLKRHQPADIILISRESTKLIDETIADQLSRDHGALSVEDIFLFLRLKFPVDIFLLKDLVFLNQYDELVMPDEDISHALKKKLGAIPVHFDKPFLRHDWGSTNISKEVIGDYSVSIVDMDRYFMGIAQSEAEKSSDFWRQVGAVVPLDDNQYLAVFNEHMPTPMEPYIYGDMRLIMKPGESPEICGALHAERSIFAQAVRYGIPLQGRDIYTTTFPCLQCAQMMAKIGFKRMFFREGYSNQNATEVLRSAGIKIIRVK